MNGVYLQRSSAKKASRGGHYKLIRRSKKSTVSTSPRPIVEIVTKMLDGDLTPEKTRRALRLFCRAMIRLYLQDVTNKRMEKAWAFYRRSTDKQELSIEDQRREVRAYAQQRGWQIVREFEPQRGYGSGLTIDRDPAFLEMSRVAEQEPHGAKYLIVYDVSRFGRLEPEDKIYWERRFKKLGGIQIIYIKDEFRNDGSIGE